jgi:hypothetical protein
MLRSAAGFTHSGDEAKTEYSVELNKIVRCKDNDVEKKQRKRSTQITSKLRYPRSQDRRNRKPSTNKDKTGIELQGSGNMRVTSIHGLGLW